MGCDGFRGIRSTSASGAGNGTLLYASVKGVESANEASAVVSDATDR